MSAESRRPPDDPPVSGGPASWRRFEAALVYHDGSFRPDVALLVDAAGRIAEIGPADSVREPEGSVSHAYDGALVPGAVNSHSHAFQILLRGVADSARDFRDWVDNHMYRLALSLDGEDLEAASRLAFAEMLKNGVTTVGEFFYLHNAPESEGCIPRGNENSRRVIRAARQAGIRIQLLRCLYDRSEKPGQKRFHEPAEAAVRHTRELVTETRDDPAVTVTIAPHSLHGATAGGIRAADELSRELGLALQIHIAEEEQDLEYSQDKYGTTPGRALQELGVLSERLCIVHGVWLDREEIDVLGEAGAGCAYNPISNMALGDGVADIPAMIRAGVTVALGCDGPGANHQVNVWQEMRFAEWLQRVTLHRMNVIPPLRPPGAGPRGSRGNYCFDMGTRNGGRILGIPVGSLEPGSWADFVVLDLDELSLIPHHRRHPDALLHNIVNSMAARAAVRHVVVAGEQVVRDGCLTRLDEAELRHRASRLG